MLKNFGNTLDKEDNKEERSEELRTEAISESTVEDKINNANKVNGLSNAVKEYVQSHDTHPVMRETIEKILFQASEDEVSYECLSEVLFSLQNQGLTGVIVDFTTSYEV